MAAIIFDLDGTIADSFDFVVDYIAKTANAPLLDAVQKQTYRGQSMAMMARTAGIPWYRMPSLFYQGRRAMRRSIGKVPPFAGMPETLAKLHAEGHELFVVSSNSVHNVRTFLHHYQLHTYFLQLYGGIGLFSKTPTLRKLIKEHNLELKDCIYVGDELRDIEAAQALKMPVIAVGWGFAAQTELRALKPDAFAHTPADLIRRINNL